MHAGALNKFLVGLVGIAFGVATLVGIASVTGGPSAAPMQGSGEVCPPGEYAIAVDDSETATWACSIYSGEERAATSNLNDEAVGALEAAGLWPSPVTGVSYDSERGAFTIALSAPLSPEQRELLERLLPKPFTIYRLYGPGEYACDNPDPPLRAWTGNATGPAADAYENSGQIEVFEQALRLLQERYGARLGAVGFPDGSPRGGITFLVTFREDALEPADIEFVRAAFPEGLTLEIWTRVSSTTSVATLPPYVKVLCG
jgi:hypothetical protein